MSASRARASSAAELTPAGRPARRAQLAASCCCCRFIWARLLAACRPAGALGHLAWGARTRRGGGAAAGLLAAGESSSRPAAWPFFGRRGQHVAASVREEPPPPPPPPPPLNRPAARYCLQRAARSQGVRVRPKFGCKQDGPKRVRLRCAGRPTLGRSRASAARPILLPFCALPLGAPWPRRPANGPSEWRTSGSASRAPGCPHATICCAAKQNFSPLPTLGPGNNCGRVRAKAQFQTRQNFSFLLWPRRTLWPQNGFAPTLGQDQLVGATPPAAPTNHLRRPIGVKLDSNSPAGWPFNLAAGRGDWHERGFRSLSRSAFADE